MSTIKKLADKKSKLLNRVDDYNLKMNNNWNTKNYGPHIKRAITKIHAINEILYKELNIDRRLNAL